MKSFSWIELRSHMCRNTRATADVPNWNPLRISHCFDLEQREQLTWTEWNANRESTAVFGFQRPTKEIMVTIAALLQEHCSPCTNVEQAQIRSWIICRNLSRRSFFHGRILHSRRGCHQGNYSIYGVIACLSSTTVRRNGNWSTTLPTGLNECPSEYKSSCSKKWGESSSLKYVLKERERGCVRG